MDFYQYAHKNVPHENAIEIYESDKSRYFIVKCFSDDNIVAALKHDVWATNPNNEKAFQDLYNKGYKVVLFFSVNGSSRFMGYATIASKSGNSKITNSPFILPNGKPYTGRLFDIKWIRCQSVPFEEVEHLKNSLNKNNESVKVGRDGQAIDETCGRELCRLFEAKFMGITMTASQQQYMVLQQMIQINNQNKSFMQSPRTTEFQNPTKKGNVKVDLDLAKIATEYNPALAIFPVDLSNISYLDYIALYNNSFYYWNPPDEDDDEYGEQNEEPVDDDNE
ncbi:bifunctional YTH domain/YTH domain containing protein [Babesia duncani]|uniref:Bifunctional YTH domain/YTH domain containing protein n=1 Tax=Babesia duncani TaxID=323732 RepID=A0AAD9PKY6_9APIC|nr:bifunctional YTH domain/YTH domain containing protein [Babesia duncani]